MYPKENSFIIPAAAAFDDRKKMPERTVDRISDIKFVAKFGGLSLDAVVHSVIMIDTRKIRNSPDDVDTGQFTCEPRISFLKRERDSLLREFCPPYTLCGLVHSVFRDFVKSSRFKQFTVFFH